MMGVGLVLLYFGLAIVAAAIIMQSDRYVVTRTATIAVDAHRLFALASDPARWAALGEATIVESRPNERVVLRLADGKSESLLAFGLKPDGAGTIVESVLSGRNGVVDKVKNLFGGRDKTFGPKMEKALADLAASA
jgi:hypothetical protein